jgi:hypothetical protein
MISSWWESLEPKTGKSYGEGEGNRFRARLFGIFYENLMRDWFRLQHYEAPDGKPALYKKGKYMYRTYDFYVEKSKHGYLVEAKCWVTYNNGYFKKLTASNAAEMAKSHDALEKFLDINLSEYEVKVDGTLKDVKSKALLWWDYEEGDKKSIMKTMKIGELWSIRTAIDDLRTSRHSGHLLTVKKYEDWSTQLFNALRSS